MKRWIAFTLAVVVCLSLCACGSGETPDENLPKYATEYASSSNPASDIAWEFARVLAEEFAVYNIGLNASEVELENAEFLEFGEELELSAICCNPRDPIENGSGTLWIRVAWSPKTNELRNIYIEFNDDYIGFEELMFSVFHNTDIEGLDEVYDNLLNAEKQTVGGFNLRVYGNAVALHFPEGNNESTYNRCSIDFLPHSAYVKNGMLYFSNGKKATIDVDWANSPI